MTQERPAPEQYLAFPKAITALRDRITGTTDREIACWIFFDQIKAYGHVYEFPEPPEFNLAGLALTDWPSASKESPPSIAALEGAFFRIADVEDFNPPARYIAFADLLQRWMPHRESQESTANFILSRIHQSRLHDFTPWLGATELSRVHFPSLPADWAIPRPPAKWAMFDLAEVEAIEASDFPEMKTPPTSQLLKPVGPRPTAQQDDEPKRRQPGKHQQQEEAILSGIRDEGFDPKSIPNWNPGSPGLKADVQEHFVIPGPIFQSILTFNKAWERLRSGGENARIQDE